MAGERFGPADVERALQSLGMLRYWPAEPQTRAEVGRLLMRMVPDRPALEWLARTMVDRVGEWRGSKELRGVLCWRYKPADGLEESCALTPGFTPEDGEARTLEIAGGERQALSPGAAAMVRQLGAGKGLR